MKKHLSDNRFLYAGLLLMLVAFLCNCSSYLYDPDDGSTIAYHVLGRNPAVQTPYNYYDSFSDHLLSFLPANYFIIYGVGLVTTLLAAIIIYILLIEVGSIFTNTSRKHMQLVAFLFLLAVPDYLYLTLSYKSSIITFSLVLLSHYLLIKKSDGHNAAKVLIAALVFGMGAAMRWNLGAYGLVIFVDVILLHKGSGKGLLTAACWAGAGLISFMLCLYFSGYGIGKFVTTIMWGREYMTNLDMQVKVVLMLCLQLLTPACLLMVLTGLLYCIRYAKQNIRVLVLTFLSVIPYFYVGFNPQLKYMITALPAMLILLTIGAMYLYNRWMRQHLVLRASFVVLLLLPWFIGIQINTTETLWGPGFELNQAATGTGINKRLDERNSARHITAGFYDGFCIPTAEGPKPLWGNFYVLYQGKVKQMNKMLGEEVRSIIAIAERGQIDVFTDRGDPMMLAGMCKEKYVTQDSSKQAGPATTRLFIKGNKTLVVKRFNRTNDITDYSKIKQLLTKRFVAHFTYTSLMADFIQHAPENGISVIEQTGPFSAVFEVK